MRGPIGTFGLGLRLGVSLDLCRPCFRRFPRITFLLPIQGWTGLFTAVFVVGFFGRRRRRRRTGLGNFLLHGRDFGRRVFGRKVGGRFQKQLFRTLAGDVQVAAGKLPALLESKLHDDALSLVAKLDLIVHVAAEIKLVGLHLVAGYVTDFLGCHIFSSLRSGLGVDAIKRALRQGFVRLGIGTDSVGRSFLDFIQKHVRRFLFFFVHVLLSLLVGGYSIPRQIKRRNIACLINSSQTPRRFACVKVTARGCGLSAFFVAGLTNFTARRSLRCMPQKPHHAPRRF